ncbi:MAG: DUF4112 domain-containing protein [Gammaproteobacteria bacterium]
MTASTANSLAAAKRRKQLERIAWVLDNSIPIPFTQRRIGLDSLIGLVPGVGDAIGGLLSTWILFQGMRLKVPFFTLMRMIMNVAIEVVLGFIPFVGDLFDMGWKANHRNVQLLSDYLDRPVATARGSLLLMVLLLVALLVVGVATVWAGVWLFSMVFGWIGQIWA